MKHGHIKKPDGRWNYNNAIDALAAHARMDRQTFLDMHPVEFVANHSVEHSLMYLLPRCVVYDYRGILHDTHRYLFNMYARRW